MSSRTEQLLQALLDGNTVDIVPQSRNEALLLALCMKGLGGGPGGGVSSWNDLTDKPFEKVVVAEWEPSSPKAADADFSYQISGGRPAPFYAIRVADAPPKSIDFETLQLNGKALTKFYTGDNSSWFSDGNIDIMGQPVVIVCYESGEHVVAHINYSTKRTYTLDAGVYVTYNDDSYGYNVKNFVNGGFIGNVKMLDEAVIPTTVPRVSTATPGQTIVVKAVDDAGKPTEWEAVDMPSAVTDEHINSLIDTKLGVIENGTY